MKTETEKMQKELIAKIQDLITDARDKRLKTLPLSNKRSERETALWDVIKIIEDYKKEG